MRVSIRFAFLLAALCLYVPPAMAQTAMAWGNNSFGQLGIGDFPGNPQPALLTNVASVSAGWYHSLAVKTDGTLWAWGENGWGQLGDGTETRRSTPVRVSGLTNVAAVSAGGQNTEPRSLAVKTDGTVWAWGNNDFGRLGDGTTTHRSTPIQVSGLTNVAAVSAGGYHSLAVKTDGTVWAWGSNGYGELGDGTTTNRYTPVQVSGLTNVASVSAGDLHSLAVKTDGTVWAWGYNTSGILGDGTTTHRSTPIQVSGLTNVAAVSAGGYHSLAVKTDGTVWAWGANYYGQLGDGTNKIRSTPVRVSGLTNVASVNAGWWHSLAVKTDGTVWAWGYNGYGQLGDGANINRTTPVRVSGLTNVAAVSGGVVDSLAVKTDGTVWAWGGNDYGLLGDGTTTNRSTPVQVSGLTNVASVSAGWYHSLAVKTDSTVWAWGYNNYGQLGDGTITDRSTPVQVIGLANVASVSAGWYHSLAVKTDGTVWAWGGNDYGLLGDGTTASRYTPVRVSGLTNVASVCAGWYHSLAVKTDGTVWAWGNNYSGQLGDGTNINRSTPVQVSGLTNVAAVSAGWYRSLAVKTDGTVWVWGYKYYGLLGDGTDINRYTPIRVSGLTNVAAVSEGDAHSLAVKTDGTVWAWGNTTLVQVAGLTNVVAVSAGDAHSLAVKADGTVWAWGNNYSGQLGDGTITDRSTPVQVSGLTNVAAVSAGGSYCLAVKGDGPEAPVYSATLGASPGAVPADGATTSRITLTYRRSGQPAAGRTISFSSSRGPTDALSASSATTDAQGKATVTISSSTPGTSTITCRDMTAGVDLGATTKVEFADTSGLWVAGRFRQAPYPFTDTNQDHWVSVDTTHDGNKVLTDTVITNAGNAPRTVRVTLHDGESRTDPIFPGTASKGVTVAPGTTEVLTWEWDTRGYAWDDNHQSHTFRAITIAAYEGTTLIAQPTATLMVKPRPLVLAHGFLSDGGRWGNYKNWAKVVCPDWEVYAVGDQPGWGAMNMGHLSERRAATMSIDENAAVMKAYIENVRRATDAVHVDIVAHSMGGLVSRCYIQKLMPDSPNGGERPVVSHLFMLGTPNLGAMAADVGDVPAVLLWMGQPALSQLSATYVRTVFNRDVNNGRNVSWWGYRGNIDTWLVGSGDGIVSLESARYTVPDSHLSENNTGHLAMPDDRYVFTHYVGPAISPGPGTNWNADPRPAPKRLDGPQNDPPADIQAVYSDAFELTANQSKIVSVSVPACTTALFSVLADEFTSSVIKDPSGTAVKIVAASSDEAKAIIRHFAVQNPAPGTWTVELYRLSDTVSGASVSCIVQGASTALKVLGASVDAQRRVTVTASYLSGAVPITGASLTASVHGIRGATSSLTLLDDGAHGDGAANDGLYGASTDVLEPDVYGFDITATGGGSTRYVSAMVEVLRPPYSFSDAAQAARIAAGMLPATAHDSVWLDATEQGGQGLIDLQDAVTITRKVAGLAPNP